MVTTEQFWIGADVGFWLWIRVNVLGVSSGGPGTVWWAGLLVCLSDGCLRLWLVWVCGLSVQGGGITEQLKPGREEGQLSAEKTIFSSAHVFWFCFYVKCFELHLMYELSDRNTLIIKHNDFDMLIMRSYSL